MKICCIGDHSINGFASYVSLFIKELGEKHVCTECLDKLNKCEQKVYFTENKEQIPKNVQFFIK